MSAQKPRDVGLDRLIAIFLGLAIVVVEAEMFYVVFGGGR